MTNELEFDIVDKPKVEAAAPEKAPPVDAGKTDGIDVLGVLLLGKAIEKKIETRRGIFTARYPSGKDRLRIDHLRALRRGGIPASTFDIGALYNNEVWSTLDVAITDGPDWFKSARDENPNWTWEECPDEEFVTELYHLVETFRGDVQKRIRESRLGEIPGRVEPAPASAPVGDGAFSGLAYGPEARPAK